MRGKNMLSANYIREDIYNLSVRRSALKLCENIIENIALLETLYLAIGENKKFGKELQYIEQNQQIVYVAQWFYKSMSKNSYTVLADRKISKIKTQALIRKTLVLLISDILSLGTIVENPSTQNKFMLCANLLSKQLLGSFSL